jgi:hypothetical protein
MTIKAPDRQGKWKTWLPILFFITGFGFLYLGWNTELSALINIGLLPIGLAVTWWGVKAIQTKESSYSSGDQDSTITYSFAGLAAIADGGLLVLVGVLAAGFGVVGLLGFQDRVLAYVNQHPGPAIIAGGLAALAYGSTLALGSAEERQFSWSAIASLPKRLLGVALVALGLISIVLGGLELVSPRYFQLLLSTVRDALLPGS